MTINDLINGTSGDLKSEVLKNFQGVSTDSRIDLSGQIFIALKGDVHDGHKYIVQAIENGASAIVSHDWNEEAQSLSEQVTWIHVDDTLLALQSFAKYWRDQWGKTVIGITGSNGKTSVKDFTSTILSETHRVLKSHGSYNNHWGVPLTLLGLRAEHEYAVVEMGMNHGGEISKLCAIATPDIALVNNVGRAHMGHFESLQEISTAKEEIYESLGAEAIGVFNLNNLYTKEMCLRWKNKLAKSFTFGDETADIFFINGKSSTRTALHLSLVGKINGIESTSETSLWGEQNISNLMAAASLCLAAGVSPDNIWKGISLCKPAWGRNHWVDLRSGGALLFDGYNANPDSFQALLDNLEASFSNQKIIAVFGEMLEQGSASEETHFMLGKQVALSSITHCLFIGESGQAFKDGFDSVSDNNKKLVISDTYKDSLALEIKSMLDHDVLVVVKGSRGGRLERVVMNLDPINFE